MSEAAKQIATVEHGSVVQQPAQPSEATAIITMIERASRDETVNIDKMRELLAMRKEIMATAAEQSFNDAMARAQSEMRAVAADANNPQTKSKYASYFALDKAVRPVYTKHGFALSFDTADGAPEQCVRVVCFVTCAGHTRKYHVDMPADGKGAKGGDVMTKTHAVGAGMSYGQRYLLKMIFNMAVGEDDDGNSAGATSDKITAEDADNIRAMLTAKGCPEAKFLKWAKVARIEDIGASYYESCVDGIKAFKKAGA